MITVNLKVFIFVSILNLVYCNCPQNSLEWQGNCYTFHDEGAEFTNAEVACVQAGGHLAAVHDAFTNAVLSQKGYVYFHGATQSDCWIGGDSLQQIGAWNWTDQSPFDYTDWKDDEPQNDDSHRCVSLSLHDSYWTSDDCFTEKPYICMIPGPIPSTTTPKPTTPPPSTYYNCSLGWIYFEPTRSCFGGKMPLVPLRANWTAAEAYCQSVGGHLPSVHNAAEANLIFTFVGVQSEDFWLGLKSTNSGRSWYYSDTTAVDYLNWANGQPNIQGNTTCVVLGNLNSATISTTNCNEEWAYICKKPAAN